MAMFGKKKHTPDQGRTGSEAETTASRARQPELMARENRAQSIPCGPSRANGQVQNGQAPKDGVPGSQVPGSQVPGSQVSGGPLSGNRASGVSSQAARPQRPSQVAAQVAAQASAGGERAGASNSEEGAGEPKKPGEAMSRPATPSFGSGPGQAAPRSVARAAGASPNAGGKRLSVGPGISLSGEIKNCEHLLVEGEIEATLKDCDSLEIVQGGLFKGTAEVQRAVVSGRFEGDLRVLDCLTVKSGGEVRGTVTYADLSIERGGRLRGKMEELDPES